MPLLKNREPYKLTESDKKRIREEVSNKFPVKFKMPPEWFRVDTLNKGRIARPPGVNLKTKSLISQDGEYVEWVYGRGFKQSKDGKRLESTTGMIEFETEMSVGETQMDLLFFLLFCVPSRKGSPLAKGTAIKPMYVVENKEKESEVELAKEKLLAAAVHYVTNEWTENRVRKVAAAMGIAMAMDKNLIGEQEIRLTVVSNVKKSKKMLDLFSKLTGAEDEISVRATIQALKDKNLIIFDDAWHLLVWDEDDNKFKKQMRVCDLLPGRDELESLVYTLKTEPTLWEKVRVYDGDIDEKMEGKAKPGAKKKE